MIDEIGIEREFFLMKGKRVIEPWKYGFPFDEFGFLVEVRTHPHLTSGSLLAELNRLTLAHEAQAEVLGFKLRTFCKYPLSKDFVKHLAKKYHHDALLDTTANIYAGTVGSHATGLKETTTHFIGTAGIHVHFSRKTTGGHRVQLPIVKIVNNMDIAFVKIIRRASRKLGEFEIKAHGFEYRSLPTDVPDMKFVVKEAFRILHEVNDEIASFI